MTIADRDQNDDENINGELAKPGVKVGAENVPEGRDEDKVEVDVAVAVATDRALTGV